VMTAGAVIALGALLAARVGGESTADDEEFVGAAVAEPV
jgi:hypothetical protein